MALECDGLRFCADRTTDLNGAFVSGAQLLTEARTGDTTAAFTAGTLVTFTDGNDQADRLRIDDVQDAIASSDRATVEGSPQSLFLSIGVGGEIEESSLGATARASISAPTSPTAGGATHVAGLSCASGTCVCARPTHVPCDSSCTDLGSDPANCGACGIVCTGDEVCIGGACSCSSASLTSCSGRWHIAPTGSTR